jgi:hypothetical protein
MARRAVILNRMYNDEYLITYRCIMWLPVPPAQQAEYVNPEFVSALPTDWPGPGGPITAAELNALRTGAWREVDTDVTAEKRTPSGALRNQAQIEQALAQAAQDTYTLLSTSQAALKIAPVLYGTTYDDATGWTQRSLPEPEVFIAPPPDGTTDGREPGKKRDMAGDLSEA